MKTSKAVVVLTSFWDANALLDCGFLLHRIGGEDTVYKINLLTRGEHNFTVCSIALSNPPVGKLAHLQGIHRLDFFCPTYDILSRYKSDGDWASYTKDYHKILKDRKGSLKDWVESLKPNHVYFLCCWENTIGGAHCHRDLLYEKFISSDVAMDKMIPIYRHGEKIYKEERDGNIEIRMATGRPTMIGVTTIGDTVTLSDSGLITILNHNNLEDDFDEDDFDDPPDIGMI